MECEGIEGRRGEGGVCCIYSQFGNAPVWFKIIRKIVNTIKFCLNQLKPQVNFYVYNYISIDGWVACFRTRAEMVGDIQDIQLNT